MRKKIIIFISIGITAVVILAVFIIGFLFRSYTLKIETFPTVNIDGGANEEDGTIGMIMDEYGFIYATGYITVPGQGKNIWLAKFESDLTMVKNRSINGPANGDDMGYVLVMDESDFFYLIGYISQTGEDHNIFIGKFDTDLNLIKNVTLNGPESGTDEGYGMIYNINDSYLYIAGTVEEPDEGYNIYLGKFDTDLNHIKNITINGLINGTDKGRFLIFDKLGNLYLSGSKSQAGAGYDFWLGKFDTNLNILDEIIIASPTTGEDKGYGLAYDGENTIYITGTLSHNTQGFDIFLAKYDLNLNQLKNITLNGPANGEDIGYTIFLNQYGLYQTGVYTEDNGGANIWLEFFNTDLYLQAYGTVDGSAHNYDTGYGVIPCSPIEFYVSGFINELSENTNIWIAKCTVIYPV